MFNFSMFIFNVYFVLIFVINFCALMYESDTIRFNEIIIELMNFNVIIIAWFLIFVDEKWVHIMTICLFNYIGYIGLSHK